ncbi:exonuclease domain-containing protein [Streptomyces goshikiensis]|uniref:3'-5' exonuclease n=1 Tax=Streptomyces goshikiensis TaxID=1942 RepID=UPI00365B1206
MEQHRGQPDPARPFELPNLFTQDIDAVPVHCVRPADTSHPTWAVYQHTRYLGTVHARAGTCWYIQRTRELHTDFANAVRALRRPPSWPRARAQAVHWARQTLGNADLRIINIQTTGLHDPRALQIAVADRTGILFNELINPDHPVDPAATRLHQHTQHTTRDAPSFSDVLPQLTNALHGRHCIAYNLPFVQQVLRSEIARHHRSAKPHAPLPAPASWEDAMIPIAQWTGLWSVQHHNYRWPRLPGTHEATAKCQAVLRHLTDLAHN